MHCKIDVRRDLSRSVKPIQDLDRQLKLPQHLKIRLLPQGMVLDFHLRSSD